MGADAARGVDASARVDAGAVEGRLKDTLGVRVRVAVLPAGTVPRTEVGKAVRVVSWDGESRPCPAWTADR